MAFNDFVNVFVRLKPKPKEETFQECLKIINVDPDVLLSTEKNQTFNFDKIFTEESTQEEVYKETVLPLVDRVKEGYNCTIFAYGQTGTGKTYTIGTNPSEEDGIISRALEDFFSGEYNDYDIHISFMEIYNEKAYDLLTEDKIPLIIRGLRIDGLSKVKVFNIDDAKRYLEIGGKNRHTGETRQNMFSSRSHAIFSVYFSVDDGDKKLCAKLNLVDLAGSESVKKTGTKGNSFQEGVNINKGLLCIGQVMTALCGNLSYIPYRQSVITTILQDSLSKNNYISLIACVKCGIEDSSGTLQTLEFSERVKKLKNKPEINELITKYKAENPIFKNNMRPSFTPLKRIPENHLKYSSSKKFRPMNVLGNSSVPTSLIFDNSKSSISSVCSNNEASNISPIIRKYMNELEYSIIDKLQTVIQNNFKKPSRKSSRLSAIRNKENSNSPKYSWNDIEKKVSKLVQSEVLQMTSKTSRATSSPFDHLELDQVKRTLNYKSPVFDTEDESPKIESIFKIPKVPLKTYESQTSLPRRSTRLSIKKFETSCDSSITEKSVLQNSITPRRSTRLSIKKTVALCDSSIDEKSVLQNSITPRRSTRISLSQNKSINNESLLSTVTPCKCSQKNLKESQQNKLRAQDVLSILNKGDIKELQKLATIGPKTAQKILIFRHFKGQFRSIKELAELPGWSTISFKKFWEQNFLNM